MLYFENKNSLIDDELTTTMNGIADGSSEKQHACLEIFKGDRRLRALFTPGWLRDDEKQTPALTVENIPSMTDLEIRSEWKKLNAKAGGEFLVALEALGDNDPNIIRLGKLFIESTTIPTKKSCGHEKETDKTPAVNIPQTQIASPGQQDGQARSDAEAIEYIRKQPHGFFRTEDGLMALVTKGQVQDMLTGKIILTNKASVIQFCFVTNRQDAERLAKLVDTKQHTFTFTRRALRRIEDAEEYRRIKRQAAREKAFDDLYAAATPLDIAKLAEELDALRQKRQANQAIETDRSRLNVLADNIYPRQLEVGEKFHLDLQNELNRKLVTSEFIKYQNLLKEATVKKYSQHITKAIEFCLRELDKRRRWLSQNENLISLDSARAENKRCGQENESSYEQTRQFDLGQNKPTNKDKK